MRLYQQTLIRTALIAVSLSLLAGCSEYTRANGNVTDALGEPLADVNVTLEHSESLTRTTTTDNAGNYSVRLKETCFMICAGSDPKLKFVKPGYDMAQTYVQQIGSECVNAALRENGVATQPTSSISNC